MSEAVEKGCAAISVSAMSALCKRSISNLKSFFVTEHREFNFCKVY